MESLAVIVPALEKNVYHPCGDLAPYGDVTLLEWKLSQVKGLTPKELVYVSSPSEKILQLARSLGFGTISRDPGLSLSEMIALSIAQVQGHVILWANVTSPFVGQRLYLKCLEAFEGLKSPFDSLMTVYPLREFALYQGKPLNFSYHVHRSRRESDPVYILTNGCFIIERSRAAEYGSYIGENPFLYEVDRLASMEIKDLTDFTVANDLLAEFMRNELDSA